MVSTSSTNDLCDDKYNHEFSELVELDDAIEEMEDHIEDTQM